MCAVSCSGLEYCHSCPRDYRDNNNISNEVDIAQRLPKNLPEEERPDYVCICFACAVLAVLTAATGQGPAPVARCGARGKNQAAV